MEIIAKLDSVQSSHFNAENFEKTKNELLKFLPTPNQINVFFYFSLLTLAMAFVMFPLDDAYSAKIHCVDDIDLEKYPYCKYVTEWNESEKFDEYVIDELANRADELNENPHLFNQIYQETIDKVNRENPGLKEKCQKIKDWIHEQIKNQ